LTLRLYIAGPLFTPYHREHHAENVRRLRAAGHECFVPQEQEHNARQSKSVPEQVFQVDLAGVRWANALIALLDGPDISSGTACEIGIFYELARHDLTKKGILGILTDERSRKREVSKAGQRLNFFTLGCLEKAGQIYVSVDGVLEHLAGWQQELEVTGLLQKGTVT
jgi:nucleoside 2-deoxyribosyltransferase